MSARAPVGGDWRDLRTWSDQHSAQRHPADPQHENEGAQKGQGHGNGECHAGASPSAADGVADGRAEIGQPRHQQSPPVDGNGNERQHGKDEDDGGGKLGRHGSPGRSSAHGSRRRRQRRGYQPDHRVHDQRRGQQVQPERAIGPPCGALAIGGIEGHGGGEHGKAADEQHDGVPDLRRRHQVARYRQHDSHQARGERQQRERQLEAEIKYARSSAATRPRSSDH